MPWDGSQNYQIPPGTEGVPDTTIESDKYNAFLHDLRDGDLNQARPIHRGGTGGTTALQALTNLGGEKAQQVVTNYDSMTWLSGSFYSAAGATNAPVAGHRFVGMSTVQDANNIVIQAFDLDSTPPGELYTKTKKDGVWTNSGAWGTGFVKKSGDTMTGTLGIAATGFEAAIVLNSPAASQNVIYGLKTSQNRWAVILGNSTAEGAGDAGSDFSILRYSNSGAFVDAPFSIVRSSGTFVSKSGTINGNLAINPTTSSGIIISGPPATVQSLYLYSVAGQPTFIIFGVPGVSTELMSDGSGDFAINHTGLVSGVMRSYRTGAVANTLVLNAGKVGIGIQNPDAALTIVGISRATTGFYAGNPTAAGGGGGGWMTWLPTEKIIQIAALEQGVAWRHIHICPAWGTGVGINFQQSMVPAMPLSLSYGGTNDTNLRSYANSEQGGMGFYVSQNWPAANNFARNLDINAGGGNVGGYIRFLTQGAGGASVEKLRIHPDGNIVMGITGTGTGKLYIPQLRVNGVNDGGDIVITQSSNSAGVGGLRLLTTGGVAFSIVGQNDWNLVFAIPAGAATLNPSGVWTNSDIRSKENVAELDERYGIEAFNDIKPIEFSFKADDFKRKSLGFSADEIEAVFPQAINMGVEGYKQINSTALIAPIVLALKQMNARLSALEKA